MGSRKKHDELKIVGGTSGLRIASEEVVKDATLGGLGLDWSEAPEDLAGLGRDTWDRLGQTFADDPTRFREADRRAIASYCMAVEMEAKAAEALREHGVLTTGRSESDRARLVKSPAWQVWRDAQSAVRAWGNELGLSPSSRSRLKLPEPGVVSGSDNPFAFNG